ncbi:MAG: protein kinase, partial [Desulfomonile tiedjei]|nr:protein kinase [Desulfomonile tiedjei]
MQDFEGSEFSFKSVEPDQQFLMTTRFFDAISEPAKQRLSMSMTPVIFGQGQRFISQGDEGDSLYIIQEGACNITLEKDGIVHPIATLGPGEVVGEMAILTGEHRSANAEAQTDLVVWRLCKDDFETACDEYPEVRHFLTQTVTNRFSRSSLTVDRTIGKYVIHEIIGRGGWSIVYKGKHSTLNMPVAIKMLKHNMAMAAEFIGEFQNEARTIAGLNHPNIVKVYDIEQLYKTVFIIMELLDGASLETTLRESGRLPLEKSLEVLLQVCAGLSYAHERGIIHRDIKPGNIFIQKNDVAKIVDFGLACATGTKGIRVVGTPKYLSPEQIRGLPVDERSDIYSLGITAFKMVTGQEVFQDNDIVSLLHMHLYEDIPDPRDLVPDLPEEMRTFILRATRREPSSRYQSIGQVLSELHLLADKIGMALPTKAERCLNMMGLFLFYRDEHQAILTRLVKDFSDELEKIGAVLRESD